MRACVLALLLLASARAGRFGSSGGSRSTSHSYPHSTGYSGTGYGGAHTYPRSHGLSGDSASPGRRSQTTYHSSRTEVHHHYHYTPPAQISYGSTYHPVYHGSPPVYVYEYRDSGSRFDSLLTGLALYNLGRMSAHNYDSHREYRGTPGEICKLGISKRTGEYEESRIDCKLMSSFIWEVNSNPPQNNAVTSHTSVTTTTNVTQNVLNGTAGNNTSITTVTVKNETVTDALKVKGPSIEVTPGMTCYMIRISRDTSVLKRNVECGLLQEYSRRSLRASSERLKPMMSILIIIILSMLY